MTKEQHEASLLVRLEFTIIVILFIVFSYAVSDMVVQRLTEQNNNRAYVYAVCEASHNEINGSSERKCGDVQDKTHTEFLCTSNNVNGECWVEQK